MGLGGERWVGQGTRRGELGRDLLGKETWMRSLSPGEETGLGETHVGGMRQKGSSLGEWTEASVCTRAQPAPEPGMEPKIPESIPRLSANICETPLAKCVAYSPLVLVHLEDTAYYC